MKRKFKAVCLMLTIMMIFVAMPVMAVGDVMDIPVAEHIHDGCCYDGVGS